MSASPYTRAVSAWAVWAARAFTTDEPHAHHVAALCRKWMAEERALLRVPDTCHHPEQCYGPGACPLDPACTE